MKRTEARRKKAVRDVHSPAEAAERAGFGPKIAVEQGFLTLRWRTEQTAQAMDSAGMNLKDLFAKHLFPRLKATKTISYMHRGLVIQRQIPDWNARFNAIKLVLEILGVSGGRART
jgi:hypothetical protein